jgi:C4-dicarboxylate-specific signal transduction histidine kinase
VIAGKVYLLKRALQRPKEISKETIMSSLETIESHVERITNVIKTLRKLGVDDDFEDFRSLNLSAVVKDTLVMCETHIKEKGIDLVMDIPVDLFVEVRPIQFAKALLNLLHNSIEAIEDSSERWIKITAHARGNVFELGISDSGPGVSDEIIGKIMQPFFTTKDVGRGSGLGLSFALSVAKNHQGSLRLDKDISPSSFIFKFPLKQS